MRITSAAWLLLALLWLSPHPAQADRPAVTAVSAKQRLAVTSDIVDEVRETVAELDRHARGRELISDFVKARRFGGLDRWALELQTIPHPVNGNYLYRFYVAVRNYRSEVAVDFAEKLAERGIAIGPSTGYFQSLDYRDPGAPLPPRSRDTDVARAPMSRWVDSFVTADYDISYRPRQSGSLSEILQLRYADGVALDVDIRVISDNRDPAPWHALAYAYMGPGRRVYPLRLNANTTPRLWHAKHRALAAMHRSNREYANFVGMATAGIMINIPLGLVVPVRAPETIPLVPRHGATRESVQASGRAKTRTQPTIEVSSQRVGRTEVIPEPVAPSFSKLNRPRSGTTPASLIARVSPGKKGKIAPSSSVSAGTLAWPPGRPAGPKPGLHEPGAAAWRYQRYVYKAYKAGRDRSSILPYCSWKKRHFDTAVRGGRPGRPGSLAHQADVKLNNGVNGMEPREIGSRIPDGVGGYGQMVTIRGRRITPEGRGRVIVESDHLIAGGTIPASSARAQIRDIRKADPSATLVVTDCVNPEAPPLIYPPGTQPPPSGPLPMNPPPRVPYP